VENFWFSNCGGINLAKNSDVVTEEMHSFFLQMDVSGAKKVCFHIEKLFENTKNIVPCWRYLWGFTVNATELSHNCFITDYNAGITIVTVH
jgi:hypothetical protein